MDSIVVTGGGGLVGGYVVRRLLQNQDVKEIRVIEKESSKKLDIEDDRLKIFYADVNDREKLRNVLEGCDAVVHCAHAPLPFHYPTEENRRIMWKDNLDAVESLVDMMIETGVKSLVHVGDAYSALPIEDNYGLGIEIFHDLPRNYMLDEYGESRSRGEMYARNAAERRKINGLFLRPTLVYGDKTSNLTEGLRKFASSSQLPYIEGGRRGLHQFLYAGNLAAIVEKSLIGLKEDPEKYSTEVVYCLEETTVIPTRDFLYKSLRCEKFTKENSVSFLNAFCRSYFTYMKYKLGVKTDDKALNHILFRLLFEKTVGFSNKKLRLLLDYKPEISQSEGFSKILHPVSSKDDSNRTRRDAVHG